VSRPEWREEHQEQHQRPDPSLQDVVVRAQLGPRLVKNVVAHQELERERQDQPDNSDEEGITGSGRGYPS
jgi:hypothetical protein